MEQIAPTLLELGIFSGKVFVIVLGIAVLLILSAVLALRAKGGRDQLEIEHLNAKFDGFANLLKSQLLDKKEFKAHNKAQQKEKKALAKLSKAKKDKKRLFVLNFEGDVKASQVDTLRQEITAILSVAKSGDEVVVNVESPGGMVHAYGLASAQLVRIKEKGIKLTVCVDKVAASGGYMMACTADQILAAPFALVGSIGVLAQVPNLNKLLKKHDIEYEEFTSGEYKKTVSMLGEITEKGRQKFVEQIGETHGLFKEFVRRHRPQVDIEKVATGEYWLAIQGKDLNLVDGITTSDEYIFNQKDQADIYKVTLREHKGLSDKISEMFSAGITSALEKAYTFSQNRWWT